MHILRGASVQKTVPNLKKLGDQRQGVRTLPETKGTQDSIRKGPNLGILEKRGKRTFVTAQRLESEKGGG